jgi:hypothetical protein
VADWKVRVPGSSLYAPRQFHVTEVFNK